MKWRFAAQFGSGARHDLPKPPPRAFLESRWKVFPKKLTQELIAHAGDDATFNEIARFIVFVTQPIVLQREEAIHGDAQAAQLRSSRRRLASAGKSARLLSHSSEFGIGKRALLVAIRLGNPAGSLGRKPIEQGNRASPKKASPVGAASPVPSLLNLVECLPINSRCFYFDTPFAELGYVSFPPTANGRYGSPLTRQSFLVERSRILKQRSCRERDLIGGRSSSRILRRQDN